MSETLTILGKTLQIDSSEIVFNGIRIKIDRLIGIKYGVSYMNVNRAAVFGSYTVALKDDNEEIKIECKNNWTQDVDAAVTFDSVVTLINHYAVPVLARNIANSIAKGNPVIMGETKLTREGVHITIGKLLWKTEHLVPWSDLGFKLWGDGYEQFIVLFSILNRKTAVAYNRRLTWNMAIFPNITHYLAPLLGLAEIRQLNIKD